MKSIDQLNPSNRNSWILNNPQTLGVHASALVKEDWNKVAHAVNDDGKGVVVLSESQMVGVAIPAAFLYEFQRVAPHLSGEEPITHISQDDFRNNFSAAEAMLRDYRNIVVLDDHEKPVFGIATPQFAASIVREDAGGRVGFSENVAQYMFSNIPTHDEDTRGYTRSRMSPPDQARTDQMVEVISKVPKNFNSIHTTVQETSLKLENF